MPTNERVRVFATGQGSYSKSITFGPIPVQASSASAVYNYGGYFVAPYVSGILPGWSIGTKPIQGTSVYGIIRAVYLTATTTISGTGSGGAGATATVRLYRSGSSAKTAATLAFDTGVDATALTPKLIPVSATLANVQVLFGDLIVFRWTQGGTGLATTEASLTIDLI